MGIGFPPTSLPKWAPSSSCSQSFANGVGSAAEPDISRTPALYFLMRLDFDTVLVDHHELRTCSIYVGEMPASLYDSQAELIFLSTGVRFARCFGWAS